MPTEILYQVVALILLIGLLIFGIILPEHFRKKKRNNELNSIVPGDKIITQQGIRGTVEAVEKELLTIVCEPDGIRLQIAQWGVRSKQGS